MTNWIIHGIFNAVVFDLFYRFVLKREKTNWALMGLVALAGMLPDIVIWILGIPFPTPIVRSYTHSLIMVPLALLILSGILWKKDIAKYFIIGSIGWALHPFLDMFISNPPILYPLTSWSPGPFVTFPGPAIIVYHGVWVMLVIIWGIFKIRERRQFRKT